MDYMATKETAAEWKVSDRRVLPLAALGADGWNLPLQIPNTTGVIVISFFRVFIYADS
ncbi:hypothetical protein V1226_02520 [Lachnospiraceae bacterium JLR.KK009]